MAKKEKENLEEELQENKETENLENEEIKEETEEKEETKEQDEVISELDKVKDSYIRLQADFENFRRRTEREKADIYKFASEKLVGKLLSVLDNLDRALDESKEDDSFTQGVSLVRKEFLEILQAEGLEEIESDGAAFDANLHHAVLMEKSDEVESGLIIETFQKGYKLNGKVIRTAMVKVSEWPIESRRKSKTKCRSSLCKKRPAKWMRSMKLSCRRRTEKRMTHWVEPIGEDEMQVEFMQKRSSEMIAKQEIEVKTLDWKANDPLSRADRWRRNAGRVYAKKVQRNDCEARNWAVDLGLKSEWPIESSRKAKTKCRSNEF